MRIRSLSAFSAIHKHYRVEKLAARAGHDLKLRFKIPTAAELLGIRPKLKINKNFGISIADWEKAIGKKLDDDLKII